MRILIVEDDPGIIVVYQQKLERLIRAYPSAAVTFVTTLSEAKKIVMTPPFQDLVVADLTLPDATWQESVAAIPELSRNSALLVVTGQPEEKVRAILTDPEVEIVQKAPELFFGTALLEWFAKVLNRHAERQSKQQHENIRMMRSLLASNAPENLPS